MSGSLPAIVIPLQLAEKGARLRGRLPLKAMRRLAAMCRDDTERVAVDLRFERGAARDLYEMTGNLSACVRVRCQRCLEEMELELRAEPRLVLLRAGEDPAAFSPEMETLIADQPVALSELVEDELLLVLPMFTAHAAGACPGAGRAVGVPRADTARDGVRTRPKPFAVLDGLKRGDK